MSEARSNLLTRGMRGDDMTARGVRFEWDGDWFHASGTATGDVGWRAYKSSQIPVVAGKQYTLSVEFADGMPDANSYINTSFQLFSDFQKNTLKPFSMFRSDHIALSFDQETIDEYSAGFQIWGPIVKSGAAVDIRVRYMLVEGSEPAAWAPAEGETLAGGGALVSANLWDVSSVNHRPDADGVYLAGKSAGELKCIITGASALTENQVVHMGASLRGADKGCLKPFVEYKDAAGNLNWTGFPAWTPTDQWQRFEETCVVPSGMTPTKFGLNVSAATGDMEVANPVFSYSSPVVLAISSSTLAWSAGIVATTRYYQLAAPTAATPTVPASSSSLGSWSETEPAADVTKVLWTCECTHYTDGTESWSQASKSTSYEAAKDAKDAATAAQSTADTAKEAASANTTDLTNYIESNDSALSQMQSQIDGSITTWFYDVAPTTDNAPAKDWTTTDLKNNHLGDLYYDTVTGYCYRYQVLNNAYSWSRITDTDVTKALSDAAAAQDMADSKRRIFVNTPTPPYDVGDQWAQGTSGDILICSTAKASGQSYAASDWTKASKYTDDTAAAAAQSTADAAKSAAADNASEIASIKTDYVTNSTFDQSNTEIKASVADTLTQAKTYTDGQISTEVTNRNAAITESANEIKSEVSETYATQDNLAAANSAITQNANAISSEVTARKTTDSNVSTLSTKVTQNADSITTEISDRESAVSTVDTKATTAQSTADDALSTSAQKIINGGFEDGLTHWAGYTTTTGTITLASSAAHIHSGAGTAWVQSTASTAQDIVNDTEFPLITGHIYRISFYAISITSGTTTLHKHLLVKDSSGTWSIVGPSSNDTWTIAQSWTECTWDYTADGSYVSAKFRTIGVAGTANDFCIDDVSVTDETYLSTLIRESSSGVDVGKSSNGSAYSTAVARVGSDGAFHILTSALVEVAKYAGTLIELGKNSVSSVIKFCAGNGQIGFDTGSNQLYLSGTDGAYLARQTDIDNGNNSGVGLVDDNGNSKAVIIAHKFQIAGIVLTQAQIETALQPFVLYNGGAALNYDTAPGSGTKGTVKLSESAANFSKLTIFFSTDQYDALSSISVSHPNGRKVSMFCCTTASGTMVVTGSVASVSGSSIAPVSGGHGTAWLRGGQSPTVDTSGNHISVVRVEGIR